MSASQCKFTIAWAVHPTAQDVTEGEKLLCVVIQRGRGSYLIDGIDKIPVNC